MGNAGLMALMMIMCCGIGAASAAVYTVGESSGWSMGSDYSTWAADKIFKVGDTLGMLLLFQIFNFFFPSKLVFCVSMYSIIFFF